MEVKAYHCEHDLYNVCTLFKQHERGLAVIQQRFNPEMKFTWWGPVDIDLQKLVLNSVYFERVFQEEAKKEDCAGLYPTMEIRKLMWRLKMKPLPKEFWETKF